MAAQPEKSPTRSTSKDEAWRALEHHYAEMRARHLRDLFAEDPKRGARLTAEAAGMFLDYSKNRIDDATLRLLSDLAEKSGLRARIDAMFRGGFAAGNGKATPASASETSSISVSAALTSGR
jgi:hypothetical protein